MTNKQRNAWPAGIDHMRGQAAMTNFWCEATDAARLGNGANHQMTGAPRPVDQALGNDNT